MRLGSQSSVPRALPHDPGCSISDPTSPHLLSLPGFTLPSYLLGVLTDLAQVPSIYPHLHPTPTSWFPPHQFPGPWPHGIDPQPLLIPISTFMSACPPLPFQKSPWLALELARLTLNSKDPPAYASRVLGLKAHTTMTSFGHLLNLSLMSMSRHLYYYSSSLLMAVCLSPETDSICSFISSPNNPSLLIDPLLCHKASMPHLLSPWSSLSPQTPAATNPSLISMVLSDPMGPPLFQNTISVALCLHGNLSLVLALPHSDAHPMPLSGPAPDLSFIL